MCLKKYWALALIAGLCCVAGLNSTASKADDDGAILNPPAANKYQPEDTNNNNVGDRNTDRNSRQIFDRINVRQTENNTDRQTKTNEIPSVKLNGRGRQASDREGDVFQNFSQPLHDPFPSI